MTTSPDPPPYDVPLGEWSGTAAFRLMPTDELAGAGSTLHVVEVAAGRAVLQTYTWTHPEDGAQTGTLMLGVPGDEGAVSAAWVDSWHQRDVATLTGRGDATSATVGYEYAPGWQWEIEVVGGSATIEMVMYNVVPERDAEPAVRYDVMRASWS
jgi:hypothetical protein